MAPLIYPPTLLDSEQVIQYVYDEATQTLRTTATAVIIGQPIEVEIDMATDSIKLGDGTTFFTSHTVGPSTGLDVYIINPSIEVTGTDFDIRDLSHTTDSIRLGDGTNFLTSTTIGPKVGLDVNIISTIPIIGTVTITNLPDPVDTNYGVVGTSTIRTASQIGNSAGAADFNAGITTSQTLRVVLPTDQTAIPVSQSGTWNINNITGTISLPTGAATSANQTTEIASLASIDSKLSTLGQKTSAASVPVVIASDQSPVAVTGTITTSPNVNIHDAAGNNLTSQINGSQRALDVGINVAGIQIDPRQIRALTAADVVTANAGTGNFTVVQPTGTNLHTVVDSGSIAVSNFPATQPISGTVSVSNLPTTIDTNYGVVGTSTIRTASQLGNSTGAALFGTGTTTAQVLRVVLPTDQTAIPVTQSGTWSTGRTWTLSSGTDSVSAVQSGTWNIGTVTSITNPVSVTQGTSPWVVSGTVIANEDKNYGTVGANTLRSAAQIGNATGQADFNAGTTSAQTLRVVLPTNQSSIPVTQSGAWSVSSTQGTSPWVVSGTVTANQGTSALPGNAWYTRITDGTVTVGVDPTTFSLNTNIVSPTNFGVLSASVRTAAIVGNATGAALFGAGTTTAQVLRVVLPTDQTAIPVTQSTSPWVISGTVTANAGTGTFTTQDTSSLVDNNPFTDGTSRVLPAGYVFDDAAGTALTENDIAAARVDSKRAQVFVIEDATTRGQKAAVSAAGALSENLTQVGGSALTLGQKTMANSIPVVLASDQAAVTIYAVPAVSITSTYSAITTGLITGLLATDIFTITGSATKTITVKKIRVTATRSGSTTTGILLIKRSTANTGGTSTAETMVPHDSNNAAATAVVRTYTVNPTLGTSVGSIRSQKQFINVAATGTTDVINWEFGQDTSQGVVLRGTSQVLAVNLAGQTITTPSFEIYIEWLES